MRLFLFVYVNLYSLDRIDSEFCKIECILLPYHQKINVFGWIEMDIILYSNYPFTFINERNTLDIFWEISLSTNFLNGVWF